MLCGKSATAYFQGRIESLAKDVVLVYGISDGFSFIYGCWENWDFPAVSFHLLVIEIILLPFDA